MFLDSKLARYPSFLFEPLILGIWVIYWANFSHCFFDIQKSIGHQISSRKQTGTMISFFGLCWELGSTLTLLYPTLIQHWLLHIIPMSLLNNLIEKWLIFVSFVCLFISWSTHLSSFIFFLLPFICCLASYWDNTARRPPASSTLTLLSEFFLAHVPALMTLLSPRGYVTTKVLPHACSFPELCGHKWARVCAWEKNDRSSGFQHHSCYLFNTCYWGVLGLWILEFLSFQSIVFPTVSLNAFCSYI